MKNLIKADMQRLLRKMSIWVAFIFMVAVVVIDIFYTMSKAPDKSLGFATGATDGISYVSLVLGIILVLNIYADDFKSAFYINVVGQGVSRLKYILVKYLDALIIIIGIYSCAGALTFGLQAGLGLQFSSLEISYMILRFVVELIYAASGISVAALCFYITENGAIGILAFLGLTLIIPIAMFYAQASPTILKYHLDKIYLDGACTSMIGNFMMGHTGAGILKLLLIIAVYIIAAIVGSVIYFRKKELEF